MTLVKAKIVSDESGITIYMWRKCWFVFGYWYPFGQTTRRITGKLINDETVSKLLFDNFFSKETLYTMAEDKVKRWESTEAFEVTCKAFSAIEQAKEEMGYLTPFLCTIDDINTLQDMLLEQGYSIQKIKT